MISKTTVSLFPEITREMIFEWLNEEYENYPHGSLEEIFKELHFTDALEGFFGQVDWLVEDSIGDDFNVVIGRGHKIPEDSHLITIYSKNDPDLDCPLLSIYIFNDELQEAYKISKPAVKLKIVDEKVDMAPALAAIKKLKR